jgi:hypothetical protein
MNAAERTRGQSRVNSEVGPVRPAPQEHEDKR